MGFIIVFWLVIIVMAVFLWFTIILHDNAFALFGPRIVLLVRGVDQGIVLLVLLNERAHSAKKDKYKGICYS